MNIMQYHNHFSDEAWFEFASAVTSTKPAPPMRARLESGCDECARSYQTWTLIVAAAAHQAEYEPAADVVASVKAAFSLARSLPLLSRISVFAQLVFDSFLEPLPAGVRGVPESVRHLLHDAGEFAVDLRLENESGGQVFLAGQALPKEAGGRATAGAGVMAVTTDGELIEQTIANSTGEFHMTFARTPGLLVYVAIPDRGVIAIPLPEGAEVSGDT